MCNFWMGNVGASEVPRSISKTYRHSRTQIVTWWFGLRLLFGCFSFQGFWSVLRALDTSFTMELGFICLLGFSGGWFLACASSAASWFLYSLFLVYPQSLTRCFRFGALIFLITRYIFSSFDIRPFYIYHILVYIYWILDRAQLCQYFCFFAS